MRIQAIFFNEIRASPSKRVRKFIMSNNQAVHTTFEEHRVDRGQGGIHVRDYAGAAPAFVLMHGFPDNLHIYDELVPHLIAAGRRVVTFDFLGFGASDKQAGATYSFAQQVGDLHAVVQALRLDKIIAVAHDSSGPAALNYAVDYPQHVSGLVILNALYAEAPTLKHPELIQLFAAPELKALSKAILQTPQQFAWVLNFQRDKFQESLGESQKDLYATFLGPLIDANFRNQPSSGPAFAQMTGELLAEEARNVLRLSLLEALTIPVKLIWGETDPYLNTGVAEDILSHLHNGRLHTLAAGHWVQLDAPKEVADLMLENIETSA
jgi:pimeloyl-ACP methyl ester carboxylesterase